MSASPASDVLTKIDTILAEYTGAGSVLEGYTASRTLKQPEGSEAMTGGPLIVISSTTEDNEATSTTKFAVRANFSVLLARRDIADRSERYAAQIRVAGEVRSILGDERRTLDGVTIGTWIETVEGPEEIGGDGEPVFMGSRVNGYAIFPDLDA